MVADVRELGLREESGSATYVPLSQIPDDMMAIVKRIGPLTWAIRTKSQASSLTETVRHEIESATVLRWTGYAPWIRWSTNLPPVTDSTPFCS